MRRIRLAWMAAVVPLLACGDEPPPDGREDLDSRLETRDERLDLEPVDDSTKSNFPKASTSSISLILRAAVSPPTLNGEILYASSVAVHGDLAFVSYHRPGAAYGGAFDVLDISDPASPELVSSRSLDGEDVNAIDSDGAKVYLAVSSSRFPFPETAAVRAYDLDAGVIDPGSEQLTPLSSYVASSVRARGGRLFVSTGDVGGHLFELDPATLSVASSTAFEVAVFTSLSRIVTRPPSLPMSWMPTPACLG